MTTAHHPKYTAISRVVTHAALVVSALLCLLFMIGYFLWTSYQHAIVAAESETRNLVGVIESRLSSEFARVDGMLTFIANEVKSKPFHRRSAAISAEKTQHLVWLVTSFPELAGLSAFDADGTLQMASDPDVMPYNIADRSYFQTLRDNPNTRLVFSEPLVSRLTDKWSMIQSLAIRDDAGRFLGTVSAILHINTFTDLFRSTDVELSHVAMLLRRSDNFKLIARIPRLNENDLNQPIPANNPIRQRIESGVRQGTQAFVANTDGVGRIASFSRLDDRFPFYVQVAFSETYYLAAWRQQVLWTGLLVVILLLAFGMALVRLHKSNRKAKVVSRKLEYRQALFGAFFDQSNFLAGILDSDSRLLEVNDTALAVIGRRRDEVINQYFPDTPWWSNAEDKARLQASIMAVNAGETASFEFEFPVAGGGKIDVVFSIKPVWVGSQHYIAVTGVDITERMLLQQELSDRGRRLDSIIEGTNAGTWEWNVQSGEVIFNERWADIFGYTLNELSPISIDTWLNRSHPDDLKRSVELLKKHFARELDYYDCEARMRHKDGHWVWVLDRGKVIIWTDDGKPLLMSGTHQDISSRKDDEQRLSEALQQAQAANIAKSRFLATMSHEIRTPMNGILGMAQLLLMHNLTEKERFEYAKTILSSGHTLLTLLNDILDLSKIEAGKIQLDSIVFEPDSLLRDTQMLFSGTAHAKGLQLETQWKGLPSRRYVSDANRIRQMLSNLVGNAIKFTDDGCVRIEGVEIEQGGASALLEFSVSDTGMGIPPEKMGLLYKPFSQTDNSITREFGGSGLGLSIVRHLAKMMGGGVGVESFEGKGSRFWFRLRAEQVAEYEENLSAEQPANDPTDPSLLFGRVLVVEDNAVNCMVIESLLTKLGISVTLAYDGQQALDTLTQGNCPDLVLMDLNMPVMDGYSATERIREWERGNNRPRLAIIALTADAYEEDRQHCLAVGMDDFLTKPIELDALQLALQKWLPKSLMAPTAGL